MNEPNREAVEAAAISLEPKCRAFGKGDMPMAVAQEFAKTALTAALPLLIAAKDAEIAALRSALGPFAAEADAQDARNLHASHDLSTYGRFTIGQCYAARAALEMSGGVK